MGTNGNLGRLSAIVNPFDCDISNGPNRETMFDLLRLHSMMRKAEQILIDFTIFPWSGGSPLTVPTIIQGIINEGAEHDWFLKVSFTPPEGYEFRPALSSYMVYYNTNRRMGKILLGPSIALMLHVSDDGEVKYRGETIANITL